ncbi:hypothetical protein [Dyella sp. EPa41]|uniref:T4 family baseplate hub assembly chaperone n=1 Tax=Dyella sp. EPa41 TaxID=1561194 RepID=UPI0019168EC4|nr:hypothetical protein [Dyella sp. EPa41]
MRTPTASELLNVWERALDAPAVARGLWLLRLTDEAQGEDAWLGLSLGDRDARLLRLHAKLFGHVLQGVATCPACQSTVELLLDGEALQLAPTEPAVTEHVLELHPAGRDMAIRFRPVNCADLLALQSCGDVDEARRQLLARCVIDVGGEGSADVAGFSSDVQAELAAAMAAADPQADIQFDCVCPECAHRWQPLFDIATFLWQELHAWALRLLREVDTLARAYHWSESDIVAMSPRRRQAYLEQCAS